MPEASFFMTLAGLGVSLAGFAGLITALDSRADAHSPVMAWRIRNIVIEGFLLTMVGFGIIAVHGASNGDVELSVRFASAALGLGMLGRNRPSAINGPAWDDVRPGQRRLTIVMNFLTAAACLVNVVFASLGWLQVLFVWVLQGPISIFYLTVREVADGDTTTAGG